MTNRISLHLTIDRDDTPLPRPDAHRVAVEAIRAFDRIRGAYHHAERRFERFCAEAGPSAR